MSDSLRPHGLYSPWNSPGQDTGVGSLSLLQGNLPNTGIELRSPTLQADSLPTELSGKPESESLSVVSDSLRPHRLYSPWNSPGQNTGVDSLSLLQGNLPNTGIEPRSPALQMDSLPAESQVKPKNTRVGSQSLRQQMFPIQESSQSLLHCRWILYQLSYQGSPPKSTVCN